VLSDSVAWETRGDYETRHARRARPYPVMAEANRRGSMGRDVGRRTTHAADAHESPPGTGRRRPSLPPSSLGATPQGKGVSPSELGIHRRLAPRLSHAGLIASHARS